jgi:flagellar hook assembly protein FlgD
LRFVLAEATDAVLTIFDAAGRQARTFPMARASAGRHELVWDGCSENGDRLPSGVYYLRLSAGGLEGARQKVVLLE